jgi:hypothetical protein
MHRSSLLSSLSCSEPVDFLLRVVFNSIVMYELCSQCCLYTCSLSCVEKKASVRCEMINYRMIGINNLLHQSMSLAVFRHRYCDIKKIFVYSHVAPPISFRRFIRTVFIWPPYYITSSVKCCTPIV